MDFKRIDPKDFREDIFTKMDKEWFLLTAGTPERCNIMTCAWGGLGVLWGKKVATVYVRRSRYTQQFMDESDTFTMAFFDPSYRGALGYCGSKSGRDFDKFKETGLTKTVLDGAVGIEEANLLLTCRKIYRQEQNPAFFMDAEIDGIYASDPEPDYHTMYIGEILGIYKK